MLRGTIDFGSGFFAAMAIRDWCPSSKLLFAFDVVISFGLFVIARVGRFNKVQP